MSLTEGQAFFVRQPGSGIRPKLRFVLIDSIDMTRIGTLTKARDRKCGIRLNTPGNASCTYPMSADFSSLIDKYKVGVLVERFNWRATAARNEADLPGEVWDPLWSGYCLTVDEDWVADKMTLNFVGWSQRFAKRIFRQDITWANSDDAVILRDMLQSINGNPAGFEFPTGVSTYTAADGYVVRWPAGSIPNTSCWLKWGGAQPNEGLGGATAYVPLTDVSMGGAGRNFKVTKYQDVATPWNQILAIENACDYTIDPVTRQLYVHRKYTRDRTDYEVSINWGPNNLAAFSRQLDGDREVNYFLAEGDADSIAAYAEDTDRINEVGLIEEVQQLSGVTGAGAGGTANPVLLAYAGAEIIVRGNGLVTYGVTPFAYSPEGTSPEPNVDYRVGDFITASGKHGFRGDFETAARVFGMNISADDNDNEILDALELSP